MDWQVLFLSGEGRIGRKDFWIGVLILFVAWTIAPVFHLLAPVIWVLLLYPWVCVFAKRLHDFGRSGWLILLPVAAGAVAVTLGLVFGGIAGLGALWSLAFGWADPGAWALVFGGLGVMAGFVALAGVVKLVFVLWVGLSPGQAGPNRFGPPPARDLALPAA
jgi:uncharacterized membrane protein YhaH (DUF805 family)